MSPRTPIDFAYDVMACGWLDAMFSTDVFSLLYAIVAVFLAIFGSFFFYEDFDNTATE